VVTVMIVVEAVVVVTWSNIATRMATSLVTTRILEM
jgi:hypothetical protein